MFFNLFVLEIFSYKKRYGILKQNLLTSIVKLNFKILSSFFQFLLNFKIFSINLTFKILIDSFQFLNNM